jgi:hypothetical protein
MACSRSRFQVAAALLAMLLAWGLLLRVSLLLLGVLLLPCAASGADHALSCGLDMHTRLECYVSSEGTPACCRSHDQLLQVDNC